MKLEGVFQVTNVRYELRVFFSPVLSIKQQKPYKKGHQASWMLGGNFLLSINLYNLMGKRHSAKLHTHVKGTSLYLFLQAMCI